MAENRNLRQTQSSGGSTPLAQEYAKRRRRKRKRPSKAMRYFAAILVIILVFFVAYSVGSWIIKNVSSSNDTNTENETEDPVTTLQKRLDELTNENKMLTEEIKELQSKVDKYNALYRPIRLVLSLRNRFCPGHNSKHTFRPALRQQRGSGHIRYRITA